MPVAFTTFDFLFVPGRGNSLGGHWQTHWLGLFPNAARVLQASWDTPDPIDWVRRVDEAVGAAPRKVVLIAHSLSTAVVVKWADQAAPEKRSKVAAAFLAATTDVGNPDPSFDAVRPFAPVPMAPLPFPALVVASRNDPRVTFERSTEFARAWGAGLADVGDLGHIGNEANLGVWPTGLMLLGGLLKTAGLGGE